MSTGGRRKRWIAPWKDKSAAVVGLGVRLAYGFMGVRLAYVHLFTSSKNYQ